jgi:hypothetical protein
VAVELWALRNTAINLVDQGSLALSSLVTYPSGTPLIQNPSDPLFADGQFYALSAATETMFKVDPVTYALTRATITPQTNANLRQLISTPQGLLVSDPVNDKLILVDPDDLSVLSSTAVTMDSGGRMAYRSPYVYLARLTTNQILVWDPATLSTVTTISTGAGIDNRPIHVHQASGDIYFTTLQDLKKIDTSSNTVVATLSLAAGGIPQGLTSDSTALFHMNGTGGSRWIKRIDLQTFTVTATASGNDYQTSEGRLVSDGTDLFYSAAAGTNANRIVRLDAITLAVEATSVLLGEQPELAFVGTAPPAGLSGIFVGAVVF